MSLNQASVVYEAPLVMPRHFFQTAMAVGSLLRTLLFDTRPTDPLTYAAVIGTVLALATAASLAPGVRAMRIDPMTALRN